MKTTVEISDALLLRAKTSAQRTGRTLRALLEEGLRRVLDEEAPPARFTLRDASVGQPGGPNPLEGLSWQDLRAEIYGGF